MDENSTHSFIVKIWLEKTLEEVKHPIWRGHITHIPSGERRYFQKLGEMSAFIELYLSQMGVQMPRFQRLLRWLNHWISLL